MLTLQHEYSYKMVHYDLIASYAIQNLFVHLIICLVWGRHSSSTDYIFNIFHRGLVPHFRVDSCVLIPRLRNDFCITFQPPLLFKNKSWIISLEILPSEKSLKKHLEFLLIHWSYIYHMKNFSTYFIQYLICVNVHSFLYLHAVIDM